MGGIDIEDDRIRRRDHIGLGSGLAVGLTVGLVAGFWVFGLSNIAAAAVIAAVGALCGSVVGRLVVGRVVADDWEPVPSGRSYVGLHAPDADERAGGELLPREPEPTHA